MKPEYIDYLTKIHNEAYLKKYYLKYLKKNEIHTFIMLDFEAFKSINDTFGHNIGDLYLQEFARIITKYFEDSIVARLHGDEFAIVTKYPEDKISEAVSKCFDLRPAAIIEMLDLRRPIYKQLSSYGHLGREELGVSWEKTDRAGLLKKTVEQL